MLGRQAGPEPALALRMRYGDLAIPWREILHVAFDYHARQLEVHTVTGRVYRSVALY